jgi:hypothetical protein
MRNQNKKEGPDQCPYQQRVLRLLILRSKICLRRATAFFAPLRLSAVAIQIFKET